MGVISSSKLSRFCWVGFLACQVVCAAQVGRPAGAAPTVPLWGIIAEGKPYATPYFVRDTGVAGPAVLVVGGIHGDEPAGAAAADQVRHWPIVRGTLVVVPRANMLALAARKRLTPEEPAPAANLNRDFPEPGGPETARGALANALWSFVREQKPDWLIDLHEGTDFRASGSQSVGSSMIVFPTPQARTAATQMLAAVNGSITNRERAYVLLNMPIRGSLARAAGAHLGAQAMILESSTKGQPLSCRTRQHRILVHALLRHLGMIDDRVTSAWLMPQPPSPGQIRVAVYDAAGSAGQGVPRFLELLAPQTNVLVACIEPEDIAEGALDQFEVVAFTGGSASRQAAALGPDAAARVRRFVEQGGGYIGICAGAYLACHGFSWSLSLLDARTVSPLWRRGAGTVQVELTAKGQKIFDHLPALQDCRYASGPIIRPAESKTVADYEVLAVFRSELAKNGTPKGVMVDSPAIVTGRFGRGGVLCSSPHPEQSKGWEAFIPRAVTWVTGTDGREPRKN